MRRVLTRILTSNTDTYVRKQRAKRGPISAALRRFASRAQRLVANTAASFARSQILESCAGLRDSEISVWTFGCPGVCNRSARNIYQSCIPTTFHVINNVDFIAYTGTWLQFKKVRSRYRTRTSAAAHRSF